MKSIKEYEKYWAEMPAVVLQVKLMTAANIPMGYELYKEALDAGGEKYFPEHFAYQKKWDAVPDEVKQRYNKEPLTGLLSFYDDYTPEYMKNWPGILAATDEDWACRNAYYASDEYKKKWREHAQKQADLYNSYFSEYGLNKTIEDYL